MFENQAGMSQLLLGQRDDIRRLAERTAEPWRYSDWKKPGAPKGRRVEHLWGLRGMLAYLVALRTRAKTRAKPQTMCCSEP